MSDDPLTGDACIEPSLAAAIADGQIDRAARDAALAHADRCEACRRLLAAVMLAAADEDRDDPGLAVPEAMRYELAAEIGRGGLGRVVRAHDRRLGRTVALKLLSARWPGTKARFLREVRITARLQHPAIVPIYDAGEDDAGEPFYAMRMVVGITLADAIAAAPAFADRLALVSHVLTAADAVAHAHAHSIVHRDLKPANVLVADLGETVVIDWGLAKDLRADHEDLSGHVGGDEGISRAGILVMGTPAYMAPEQARGERVDPRSDVWALGGILYTVMSGRAPVSGDTATAMIQRAAAAAPIPLEDLAPETPPELAAIVSKAMAPAPDDRYPSARELARDLRRFTTGKLVGAASYSSWQLARRWLRHRRAAAAAAAVLAIAAVAGGAIGVARTVATSLDKGARLADSELRRSRAEARGAELVLANARGAVERDPTEALAWLAQYGGTDWQYASAIAAEAATRGAAAHVLRFDREIHAIALSDDGAVLAVGSRDEIVWIDARRGDVLREQPISGASSIVFAGGAWVIASGDGALAVTDTREPEPRVERIELFDAAPRAISVSRAGDAVCAAGLDGKVYALDIATARATLASQHVGAAEDCAIDEDGRVWSVGADRTLRGAATEVAPAVAVRARSPLARIGFGGDGGLLAAGTDGIVYALRDGRLDVVRQLAREVADGAWQHLRLASGGASFTRASSVVQGWTGALFEHAAPVRVVASDAHYCELVSGDADGTIYLWCDGAMQTLTGHRDAVVGLTLARDGASLASVAANGELRLWALGTVRSDVMRGNGGGLLRIAVAAETVYATARSGRVLRWEDNAPAPTAVAELAGETTAVAADSAGLRVAAASSDGSLLAWQWRTEAWRHRLDRALRAVAFGRDGQLVATAGDDGQVRLWSAESGAPLAHADATVAVFDVEIDATGEWLASIGDESALRVWRVGSNAQTMSPFSLLSYAGKRFAAARFSPDAREIVAASEDGAILRWPMSAGSPSPAILARHHGRARALAVAAQGHRFASGGADGDIWLIEPDVGAPTRLRGHRAEVEALAFSPDGSMLASASRDGQVRLWASDGAWSTVLLGHRGPVNDVAFDSLGRVYSAGEDDTVRAWRHVSASRAPAAPALAAWLARKTTARIGGTGIVASAPTVPRER